MFFKISGGGNCPVAHSLVASLCSIVDGVRVFPFNNLALVFLRALKMNTSVWFLKLRNNHNCY